MPPAPWTAKKGPVAPTPEGLEDDAAGQRFVRDLAQRTIDTGVYAHQWKPGDLVLWDNRMLLHAASPCCLITAMLAGT